MTSPYLVPARMIFDGDALLGPGVVHISGDSITDLTLGLDAIEEIDLEPVPFVMPGLIDAHVHSSGYREGIPAGNPYGPVKHFMRLCMACGVTTIRDVGNSLETLYYFREWNEKFVGPRIYGSGPLLDGTPFTWPFSRRISSHEDAQFHAAQLVAAKVDLLKTYARLEFQYLPTVVKVASEAGINVASHCGKITARQAAEAGVRSTEHAEELLSSIAPTESDDDSHGAIERAMRWARVNPDGTEVAELGEVYRASGTALCPTLLVSRRWCFVDEMTSEPANDVMTPVMPYHAHFQHARGSVGIRFAARYMAKYMPVRTLTRGERVEVADGLANMGAVVARLARGGVEVVAGTDTPNPSIVPGHSLRQEMALLRQAGIPGDAVLRSATSVAADVLGVEEIGRLKPGGYADILELDGDPSTDIRHLSQVRGVWKGGTKVDLVDLNDKIANQVRDST